MRNMLHAHNKMKESVDARNEQSLPVYTLGKKKTGKHFRRNLTIGCVLVLFFATLYIPPALLDEPAVGQHSSIDLTSSADKGAMETAQRYLKNNPDADFDGDGLTNEMETNIGTGVYIADNDNDGVSDYAELYITETNSRIRDDSILNFVINADTKNGNSVKTPFRANDVVLWADNYTSKARGSVVPLRDGSYAFRNFSGWAQFPTGTFAYSVDSGLQTRLKTNERGYFYVDTEGDRILQVRAYDSEPQACHVVSLLGKRYKLPDNIFTRVLSFILPSRGLGLVTCRPALSNDFDDSYSEVSYKNDFIKYTVGEKGLPDARFGTNQNTLSALGGIFSKIDAGENIIVSLMSHEVGEVLVEVYGYTNKNNLLVCDPVTGIDYGIIDISPYSTRMLDSSGGIQEYQYFTWAGCGYSSASKHRLVVVDLVNSEDLDVTAIGDYKN